MFFCDHALRRPSGLMRMEICLRQVPFHCEAWSKSIHGRRCTHQMQKDPNHSKRDLCEAIERGENTAWTTNVKVMQLEEADPELLGFDSFDVIKV
jgi:catalase